ncbi:unnamed protein product [Candida verbasci]|uniref:Uncharacterized protein n=1 Tax=Candida verbasci TaxID=1227364 RepID=A0A9W4TU34_9ASCO|nr:unnamed protein product [Candida verbasci]
MFICRRFFHQSRIRSIYKLRDYQHDAIDSVLGLIDNGVRRSAVVIATGGGKTVIFSHLISKLKPFNVGRGNKTLVIAHTEELIKQASEKIQLVNPELKVEKEIRKLKASSNADVIVASIQSIVRRNRYERFNPNEFKSIIIDECHHSTAKSYMKILTHFNATNSNSEIYVIGFTATLTRLDNNALNKVFDKIAYERSLNHMIDNKELVEMKISISDIKVNLNKVVIKASDYESNSLYQELKNMEFNEIILLYYLKLQKQYQYKSTMVFCVNIEHCRELCGLYQSYGINAQYVTGETSKVERENIIEDFKNGKIPVLCNVGVFTEGTDIPNIDCVILGRPTLSKSLMIQMVGRGLRLHEDKTHCHVLDLVGLTLDGLEVKSSLEGKDLKEKQKHVQEENEESIEIDEEEIPSETLESVKQRRELAIKNVLRLLDSGLFKLKTVDGTSIPEHWLHDNQTLTSIFAKGPWPWVNVRNGHLWILQISQSEFISVRKKGTIIGTIFELSLNKFPESQYSEPEEIKKIYSSSNLMEIFEKIESEFKDEVQKTKRMNVYYKFATEKQIQYVLGLYNGRIEGYFRKYHRNQYGKLPQFKQSVEKVLQKERLGLMSKFITALRYGQNNSYTFIKWNSILKKAGIEMNNI